MLKYEIRKLFSEKRVALSATDVKEFDVEIKIKLENLLPQSVKTVHIYLPIPSKKEIDTWPIIRELWAQNIRVVSPVMDPKNNLMSSWQITDKTQIELNGWNVPEPAQSFRVNNEEVDAIIVPLLAFDKKGFRVGYGKAYYDRFIASLDREILKIGLSYFQPIDKITDINSWDIPLDHCITPTEIFKF